MEKILPISLKLKFHTEYFGLLWVDYFSKCRADIPNPFSFAVCFSGHPKWRKQHSVAFRAFRLGRKAEERCPGLLLLGVPDDGDPRRPDGRSVRSSPGPWLLDAPLLAAHPCNAACGFVGIPPPCCNQSLYRIPIGKSSQRQCNNNNFEMSVSCVV